MIRLLHTTMPDDKTAVWLPVELSLAVCTAGDEDMAWAGAMGTAAKASAVITARLNKK